MRKLCCACHSSSIAALIYIIAVPDMHGQKVDTENYQPHVNLHAIAIDDQRQPFERSLWRRSKFKHFNTAVLSIVSRFFLPMAHWFHGGAGPNSPFSFHRNQEAS